MPATEQKTGRGLRGSLLFPTLACLCVVASAVLSGGLVDGCFTSQLHAHGEAAIPTAPDRLAPDEFLAHAVAAQCGLLVALAVTLAFTPAADPFGPGNRNGRNALAGISVAIGINAAGSWLMNRTGETYLGIPDFRGAGASLAIVVVAGITAPWIEELFFREAILVRLLAPAPRGYALLLSSVAFGALHLPAGGLVLFGTMTGLGAVFGWLRLRTGSLAPAVAAHAFNNLLALGLAWWAGSGAN